MNFNAHRKQPASVGRVIGLIVVALFGLGLLGAGGWCGYQAVINKGDQREESFTIKQSVDHEVNYFDNSFFKGSPAPLTNAYVTELVNNLTAKFRYEYRATTDAPLRYTYYLTSSVRSLYQQPGADNQSSVVWSKDYALTKPVTKSTTSRSFVVQTATTIPYRDYKRLIDQFDTTLNVGTTGEAVVSLHVSLQGTYKGTPFQDSKTSSLVAPLTQSILTTNATFEKSATGTIAAKPTTGWRANIQKFYNIAAALLIMAGLSVLTYAYRNRTPKSKYERELHNIYKLHDGIIIRSKSLPDLDGKQRIPVEHFSDLLNIEEELKAPIIACRLGDEGTLFLIIRSDVVYEYILGRPSQKIPEFDIFDEIAKTDTRYKNTDATAVHHPRKPHE